MADIYKLKSLDFQVISLVGGLPHTKHASLHPKRHHKKPTKKKMSFNHLLNL